MITKNTLLTAGTLVGMIIPQIALGYITPEEVLLNRELYLPPSPREAQMRTEIQSQESADRRAAEQQANYESQHPSAPEEEEVIISQPETTHGSAPDEELSPDDLELLRSLRLLNRVQENQEITKLQQQIFNLTGQTLHTGAPQQPLAPTGAGTVVAGVTAAGALYWTLRKARKSENKAVQY